jgi:hypothetical protein
MVVIDDFRHSGDVSTSDSVTHDFGHSSDVSRSDVFRIPQGLFA